MAPIRKPFPLLLLKFPSSHSSNTSHFSHLFRLCVVIVLLGWEMAGGGASKSSNAPRVRKRVEAETGTPDSSSITPSSSLKRAKDGSAFVRWYFYTSILFFLSFFLSHILFNSNFSFFVVGSCICIHAFGLFFFFFFF